MPAKIGTSALWATTLGPIVTFLGYTVGAMLWPGFDGGVHTISDLAADDSPVQIMMSLVFLFGALCDFAIAYYVRVFPMRARVVIFISGLSTIGLTIFTTPSQEGHSVPHRIFAITSFILLSIWPLFAMSKAENTPPLIRPRAAVWTTVFLVSVSVWFLSLWADKGSQITGIGERIGVGVQGIVPAIVIWHSWLWLRKQGK